MSEARPLPVFSEEAIRAAVTDEMALEAADRAFRALGRGRVTVPAPFAWDFPEVRGEVHVKGAHLHGSALFTFKVATGFFGNLEMGVPTGSGMVLMFDSNTGFPRGVLADNGYLTDLRTAAAGALAASHLTMERPLAVGLIGAGVQAYLQSRLLASVREVASVAVWSRSSVRRERLRDRLIEELGQNARAVKTVEEAVAEADLVLTATPSRAPIVEPGWTRKGVTIVAIGADGPAKQELAAEVVAGADKVVTDLTAQCVALGELRSAVEAGLMGPDDVYAELGQIVIGRRPGREGNETIVCDLTGVGAQDAAMTESAFIELSGRETRVHTAP
jgi:ornithine cyclodeaminase